MDKSNDQKGIKYEQEITVMVNCNTETLIQKLENKGFEKVDEYFVDDEYYVKKKLI